MIKKIVTLICAVLMLSCADQQDIRIIGSVQNIEDGTKIYRSTMGEQNNAVPKDTVELANGKFEFSLKGSTPQELGVIRVDGVNGNVFYIYEDENIEVEVYPDSIRTSKITAGKHNQLMQDYLELMGKYRKQMLVFQNDLRAATVKEEKDKVMEIRKEMQSFEKQEMQKIKEFGDENAESVVGMVVYSDLINQKKVNNKELKEFYERSSKDVKDHVLGRMIKEKIATINATDIGAVAPDFKGPTPDGNELELHKSLQKLTLVDFWASWCKPCRVENPNIVSIYEDYKDKGFHVIGVSLDRQNQEQKWIQAIEADGLDWDHVSHLKFWKEPIALQYGVKSIPQAFLLDEDGVIVAKNLRGDQLRQKVAELLDDY